MTPTLTLTAEEAAGVGVLRDLLDGEVVLPQDAEWDEARQAWNLAVDQRPIAVVFAESADDVVAVLEFARASGLYVAPQGTGHFAASIPSLEDTILLKTSRMRGRVEIDATAQSARVEAGVLWEEVLLAAAEHGLAALAGSSPDVGVVGYTLGGGIGWLGRKYGLAANSVLSVELVLADGRLVRIDAKTEPELFWAVRGAGGSFGIVTAIEFALYPVAEVYAGILFFPVERASEVLVAWREWIADVPRDVTSIGRILHLPPIPDIPEPLRGRSFVAVEAAMILSEPDAAELLRPLRELGPELDTFATIPTAELRHLHMDPPHPVPFIGDGVMLADFPGKAVDALVDVVGDPSTPLVSIELRQLGGAVADESPEHGAVGALADGFALFAVGMAANAEASSFIEARVAALKAALGPWAADRGYFNFSDTPLDGDSLYPARHLPRPAVGQGGVDPRSSSGPSHPIRPLRPAGVAPSSPDRRPVPAAGLPVYRAADAPDARSQRDAPRRASPAAGSSSSRCSTRPARVRRSRTRRARGRTRSLRCRCRPRRSWPGWTR